jgi:acyl carrier protein
MTTTLERFQEILKPVVNSEVTTTTTIRSLHLCPLDLVELITNLEDKLEIEIEDEAAEKFQTVGEIVHYIDRKLAMKGKA